MLLSSLERCETFVGTLVIVLLPWLMGWECIDNLVSLLCPENRHCSTGQIYLWFLLVSVLGLCPSSKMADNVNPSVTADL